MTVRPFRIDDDDTILDAHGLTAIMRITLPSALVTTDPPIRLPEGRPLSSRPGAPATRSRTVAVPAGTFIASRAEIGDSAAGQPTRPLPAAWHPSALQAALRLEVARVQRRLSPAGVACRRLTSADLHAMEPSLTRHIAAAATTAPAAAEAVTPARTGTRARTATRARTGRAARARPTATARPMTTATAPAAPNGVDGGYTDIPLGHDRTGSPMMLRIPPWRTTPVAVAVVESDGAVARHLSTQIPHDVQRGVLVRMQVLDPRGQWDAGNLRTAEVVICARLPGASAAALARTIGLSASAAGALTGVHDGMVAVVADGMVRWSRLW